jgi:hypothetical protein
MRDVIHSHQAPKNSPGDPVVVDEPTTPMRPLHLTRPQAIAAIRERLAKLCDEEHCACSAAAHLGVMCKGFAAMTDDQLRKRFDWIARRRPGASREELERLVSLYHIGREEVGGFALCCDAETRDHCGCDGWNQFDNTRLAETYKELTGREAIIG